MTNRSDEEIEALRKRVCNNVLRAQLLCVRNNVPFDVAFSLDVFELEVYSIIFQEFDGAEYDFQNDMWKKAND